MLTKIDGQYHPHPGPVPEGSRALQRDGHYLLRGALGADEVEALAASVRGVYRDFAPDVRAGRTTPKDAEMYRYEMFNRSEEVQRAVAKRAILDILEPLLGPDCHLVNCTAFRNPPGDYVAPQGIYWHTDGGPHVPRFDGSPWPEHIPYPVFVVATHIYLQDVSLDDGPSAVITGSHTSGRTPPQETRFELDLDYPGGHREVHLARAGDIGFFVSDVWHRRLPPTPSAKGRFFLQSNYGRREIAQRIRPTEAVNHATHEAIARAASARERELLGVHPQSFYDG